MSWIDVPIACAHAFGPDMARLLLRASSTMLSRVLMRAGVEVGRTARGRHVPAPSSATTFFRAAETSDINGGNMYMCLDLLDMYGRDFAGTPRSPSFIPSDETRVGKWEK